MKSYHKDKKRVKTKERTKTVKSYSLKRQEELERQCEEFFISLDNVDIEGESHEEVDDCDVLTSSLEEGQLEVCITSLKSKPICVETQGEETEKHEPKTLEGSVMSGMRRKGLYTPVLWCMCKGCKLEFFTQGVNDMLGYGVGQEVTMGENEEQWVFVVYGGSSGCYSLSCLEASAFLDEGYYFTLRMTLLRVDKCSWELGHVKIRTTIKECVPGLYGKINCKMKISQSSYSNIHTVLPMLTNGPRELALLDTRRVELIMILEREFKIMPNFELKIAWKGIITAEGVGTRASSDKIRMDVFEWMIAWERTSSAEFIR